MSGRPTFETGGMNMKKTQKLLFVLTLVVAMALCASALAYSDNNVIAHKVATPLTIDGDLSD